MENNKEEKITDVKGTIIGFVEPDPIEQSQEEEIQKFKLKKQNERELAKLSEEEQKEKRKKYEEEEEKLEDVKAELIKSIKERIPAIEKKFRIIMEPTKKIKITQKVQEKTVKKEQKKEEKIQEEPKIEEQERE